MFLSSVVMLGLLFVGLNVNGEEFVLDEAVLEEIGIDNLNLEDNTLMSTATIYKYRTNIFGSSATANWDLSWSNTGAPFSLSFNHGDDNTRIIDKETDYTARSYSYRYHLPNNVNAKFYNISLLVGDKNGNLQSGKGEVYQTVN